MDVVLSPPSRGLRGRSWFDWAYAAALVLGALFALGRYGAYMDIYEKAILLLAAPVFIALGWAWGALRVLCVVVAAATFIAIGAYQGELSRSEQAFLLKYLVSSQSAIMWMCALFFLSTASYWAGLVTTSDFASKAGSGLAWSAAAFGTIGLLVRWYESYLIGPDVGHIPVSNLYEVFVLFSAMTALFYLYYEECYATRQLGAFVMVVVSAAVGFLLWYTFEREAQEIQPLVPALQSWWMKIHVPANFVGYGTFSLAAMVGFAYLVKTQGESRSGRGALALWGAAMVLALLLALEAVAFRRTGSSVFWLGYFALFALVFGGIVAARKRIAARLPARELLDDLMYRSIAVGFGFFTIATILGALWAAEAWGAYWSWDPKETWALIVWLNYAAWLHMRQMKGMRGAPLAWWALGGLLVTTFAFLGVNMFLSGLHSYGQL
ncbi:MAG: c-type cytochrome biogenesis protein CcsB [Betaproteobacteria bacterium]|nr:c-type cytochrome biogenesis protein CcsB [Betaproteobacteria bacterium]